MGSLRLRSFGGASPAPAPSQGVDLRAEAFAPTPARSAAVIVNNAPFGGAKATLGPPMPAPLPSPSSPPAYVEAQQPPAQIKVPNLAPGLLTPSPVMAPNGLPQPNQPQATPTENGSRFAAAAGAQASAAQAVRSSAPGGERASLPEVAAGVGIGVWALAGLAGVALVGGIAYFLIKRA